MDRIHLSTLDLQILESIRKIKGGNARTSSRYNFVDKVEKIPEVADAQDSIIYSFLNGSNKKRKNEAHKESLDDADQYKLFGQTYTIILDSPKEN